MVAPTIHVVAGVLFDPSGRVLVARRPSGSHLAGPVGVSRRKARAGRIARGRTRARARRGASGSASSRRAPSSAWSTPIPIAMSCSTYGVSSRTPASRTGARASPSSGATSGASMRRTSRPPTHPCSRPCGGSGPAGTADGVPQASPIHGLVRGSVKHGGRGRRAQRFRQSGSALQVLDLPLDVLPLLGIFGRRLHLRDHRPLPARARCSTPATPADRR